MPNLYKILASVNPHLKSCTLESIRLKPCSYSGIARFGTEEDKDQTLTRPYIVDNDGRCTPVTVDDTIDLQIYHRIKGLRYEEDETDNFGEKGNTLKEIASMVIIVCGDRNNLQLTPENLVAGIAVDIKKQFLPADLVALQVKQCELVIDDVEVDQEKVYVSEYSTPYALKPNYIMCSVNYQIMTVYNKACFNLCLT